MGIKKIFAVAAFALLVGGVFLLAPVAHAENGYWYESAKEILSPGVLRVTREMLEKKEDFSCDIRAAVCISIPSSTPPTAPSAPDPFSSFDAVFHARKKIAAQGSQRGAIVDVQGRVWGVDLLARQVLSSTTRVFSSTSFATLSPDGRWLAFYESATKTKYEKKHTLVSLDTGEIFTASRQEKGWDVLSEGERMFSFSPDSRDLYYLDNNAGFPSLYRVSLAALKKGKLSGTALIAKKYTITDFLADTNGRVYVVSNRESPYEWGLWEIDSANGKTVNIAPAVSYGQALIGLDDSLVFGRAGECGVRSAIADKKTRAIRDLPLPRQGACNAISQATPGRFAGVPGVVSLPDGYSPKKKYPLYLWLHGGPYRQSSLGYHPYASYGTYDYIGEALRKAGAIIVKLDYRGSFGFGNPYADSLRRSIGSGDVADVMSALSAIKKKYSVGEAYLAGVSYGGYLALRSSVAHPGTFAGAVSVNGVTDWRSLAQKYSTPFEVHFGGDPKKANASLYQKADISSRVGRLRDEKIVLIAGKDDSTVPYWQTDSLYGVFEAKGKKADLLALEGENHVLKKNASVSAVCARIFDLVGLPEGGACSL